MAKIPVALQIYTVRDEAAKDFTGTLERIAALGYVGVELGGTGDLSVPTLKKLLQNLGLGIAGNHVGLEVLETDLESVLDVNAELGNRYVACPWAPPERRKDADGYRRLAETLTGIGRRCRERGMLFCYHHHDFELAKHDGQPGLDILLGASDPDAVRIELDTYWAEYGGGSAVDYLTRYTGRIPLVHLKDMADDEKRSFAEVGSGILDFDAIFAAGEKAGVEWWIVEQDICPGPSMESAKISFEYLRKRGIA